MPASHPPVSPAPLAAGTLSQIRQRVNLAGKLAAMKTDLQVNFAKEGFAGYSPGAPTYAS